MEPHLPPSFRAYANEDVEQLAVGSAGKDGVLEATFTRDSNGVTNVSREFIRPPFHLMRGLHHDEQLDDLVTLYIQNPSGGVTQGDRFRIDLDVQPDAKAHVTTQGSTKTHRMEKNYARSCVDITVEDGGYLEYIPDPTILYRDSRYQQTIDLDVHDGATAVVSEIIVPGRLARGERFEYDRYHSTVRADYAGTRVLTDTIDISPDEDELRRQGLMGEYPVVGSLYVLTGSLDADELSDTAFERLEDRSELVAGTSVISDGAGVVLRALGHTAEAVEAGVHDAWDATRTALFGVNKPKQRKY